MVRRRGRLFQKVEKSFGNMNFCYENVVLQFHNPFEHRLKLLLNKTFLETIMLPLVFFLLFIYSCSIFKVPYDSSGSTFYPFQLFFQIFHSSSILQWNRRRKKSRLNFLLLKWTKFFCVSWIEMQKLLLLPLYGFVQHIPFEIVVASNNNEEGN